VSIRQANPPSDLQLAVADYAWQQIKEHGKTLAQVVVALRPSFPDLTKARLECWMHAASPETVADDPFGGERDETRRAERLEQRIIKAAETIPGASDLLGIERFVQHVHEAEEQPDRRESMVEVIARFLDFLVPELTQGEIRYVNSSMVIPQKWSWQCWDDGSNRVLRSTLALHNADGNLVHLCLRTRPRGKPYPDPRGWVSTWLPVRRATVVIKADKEGVVQRLIQAAQEFRASRHGRITQTELAAACDRTKQAISHQRLLMWDKVQNATGGRANSPGLRNLARSYGSSERFKPIFEAV